MKRSRIQAIGQGSAWRLMLAVVIVFGLIGPTLGWAQVVTPDAYEVDDSVAQAGTITLGGAVQQRTLSPEATTNSVFSRIPWTSPATQTTYVKVRHADATAGTGAYLLAVIGPNTAPMAMANSYSTPYQTALSLTAPGVPANDMDAESNPLTAVWVSDPLHGTLTLPVYRFLHRNGIHFYTAS